MPAKNSAAKRHRQSETQRRRNRIARSRIHTVKRNFLEAIEQKDGAAADAAMKEASKLIDAATNKGLYHRNTADRKKSRLHRRLNTMRSE